MTESKTDSNIEARDDKIDSEFDALCDKIDATFDAFESRIIKWIVGALLASETAAFLIGRFVH